MRKKKLKIEKPDEKDLGVERLINEGLIEIETQERREQAKLHKVEREKLDKLVDEIAIRMKKLDTRKEEPVLPEETRKYIEEAKKKYPELIEE